MGVLTIYLDKATNLKDKDTIGKSDPYIKFSLEQDNMILDKNYGSKKSTTKKGDLNPVYGETFTFDIPSLKNMELKIKESPMHVMDDDIVSDDKMGKSKIKLEKLGLTGEPMVIEEKVYNRVFGKDSYVHLKLSYTE